MARVAHPYVDRPSKEVPFSAFLISDQGTVMLCSLG
jgi:hypothetical protein